MEIVHASRDPRNDETPNRSDCNGGCPGDWRTKLCLGYHATIPYATASPALQSLHIDDQINACHAAGGRWVTNLTNGECTIPYLHPTESWYSPAQLNPTFVKREQLTALAIIVVLFVSLLKVFDIHWNFHNQYDRSIKPV